MSSQYLDFQNDEYLRTWLENRKKGTTIQYQTAMRRYVEYTGMTPEELYKEKEMDLDPKVAPKDRGKAERRVKGFFQWLKTEYVSKKGKPMSSKGALTYIGAVADFYSSHNVPLRLDWKNDFKSVPKDVNRRERMTPTQVEKLAYYAPELRDKAIIWCQFQGLMDVSTVLSLNVGLLLPDIENTPMGTVMFRGLVRGKEEVSHCTLIYKTAIRHLKAYLKERFGEDWLEKIKEMPWDTPLFVGRTGKRHDAQYVHDMFREVAPLTYIANSRFEHADINPLGSHSLRESASSLMKRAGASKEECDYWMGHKLHFEGAYGPFGDEDSVRETYVKYAEALEPKGIPPDLESELDKRDATIDYLEKRLAETQRSLQEALIRLGEAEKVTKPLGGLPPEMLDRFVQRLMHEELVKMEMDEAGEEPVEVDEEKVIEELEKESKKKGRKKET